MLLAKDSTWAVWANSCSWWLEVDQWQWLKMSPVRPCLRPALIMITETTSKWRMLRSYEQMLHYTQIMHIRVSMHITELITNLSEAITTPFHINTRWSRHIYSKIYHVFMKKTKMLWKLSADVQKISTITGDAYSSRKQRCWGVFTASVPKPQTQHRASQQTCWRRINGGIETDLTRCFVDKQHPTKQKIVNSAAASAILLPSPAPPAVTSLGLTVALCVSEETVQEVM